ncbi:SRPBCC family protein [Nonomuraea sp. NPDC048916]|uniref:SRPBCC family protein n=1 Tax=Nonomuraea sp. NPDC048916 TaxID=3154232 RepID=UPI0033F1C2EC
MIDIINEIARARREVSDGAEVKTIVVRRRYDAALEEVWDACTDAERIGRWFLPISGDLRLGGHFQLEGNAGGEILHCEPPHALKVTWVMGDAPGLSEVEVRLTAEDGDATLFELRHTAQVPPEMWSHYGPGAVGIGWDLTVLGLGLHLAGGTISDPDAWQHSDEARRFMAASGQAWGEAFQAAGVPPEQVATVVENTIAFYIPQPSEEE